MGKKVALEPVAGTSSVPATSEPLPWKGFFAAIRHEQKDEVFDLLNEYTIGGYIIGYEISPDAHKETEGHHMHFVVQISSHDYHNFSERLKRKYNLRAKALKDKPRQFGALGKIEKLEKLKAYTIKDGDYRSNLSDKELESLAAQAYKKETIYTEWEKLVQHLDGVGWPTGHCTQTFINAGSTAFAEYARSLRYAVIEFHVKNKTNKGLTKSSVESAQRKYVMYHARGLRDEDRVKMIFEEFFSW